MVRLKPDTTDSASSAMWYGPSGPPCRKPEGLHTSESKGDSRTSDTEPDSVRDNMISREEAAVTDNDEPMVLRALDDGVLTLTLNRGARFNPLSLAMIAALDAELSRAARDASVAPWCCRRLAAASQRGTT